MSKQIHLPHSRFVFICCCNLLHLASFCKGFPFLCVLHHSLTKHSKVFNSFVLFVACSFHCHQMEWMLVCLEIHIGCLCYRLIALVHPYLNCTSSIPGCGFTSAILILALLSFIHWFFTWITVLYRKLLYCLFSFRQVALLRNSAQCFDIRLWKPVQVDKFYPAFLDVIGTCPVQDSLH